MTIGSPTRRLLLRLHRNDRGHFATLLMLTLLALVALIAMVFNTGNVTSEKMRAQLAADAAAYSAAGWNARSTNLVTGANMLIVRTASAEALGYAVALTVPQVIAHWAKAGLVGLGAATYESFLLGSFVGAATPGMNASFRSMGQMGGSTFDAGTHRGNIRRLYEFQQQVVDATPDVIERQRQAIEQYYGCDIVLATPRPADAAHAPLTPPVRQPSGLADATAFGLILGRRVMVDSQGWAGDWRLRSVVVGKGVLSWRIAAAAATAIVTARYGDWNHPLVTQQGPMETGSPLGMLPIAEADRLTHFSVVALAQPRRQTPRSLAGRVFPRPLQTPLAYAQAEIFNGNEGWAGQLIGATETIFDVPGVGAPPDPDELDDVPPGQGPDVADLIDASAGVVLPWRVWSTQGFNWQPRLATGLSLEAALEHNERLRDAFEAGGLRYEELQDGLDALIHY